MLPLENPHKLSAANMNSPEEGDAGRDPIEAIYALNIGDFITDSFISDDLLHKISHRLGDDPGKLKAQLEELIHIYSMDKTLGVLGLDAQAGFLIYDSIASTLAGMFQVDACHVFQSASQDNGESFLSLTGTSLELENGKRWEIAVPTKSHSLLCDIYRGKEAVSHPNLSKQPHWQPIERIGQQKTRSLLAAPMREGHKHIGVLLLESYTETDFSPEMLKLAAVVAQVFVTGLRLQQLVAEAQVLIAQGKTDINTLMNMRAQITESIADLGIHQQEFVEALSDAVDARCNFTRGHSRQVGTLAHAIAEALELNEKSVDLIYLAGLLGSVGKVNIPKELISRTGQLNQQELDRLRDHPNVGVSLLVKINFLSEVIPYVHYQNERWDGSGPEGLKGRSTPLGARILAVANAYYGMTQERPYRGEPMKHEAAIATLQKEAGAKWDPLIVDTLAKISPETLA
jgi:HD-GYP domain-containing protein (c-di-GMP phosphodiesterase class II)